VKSFITIGCETTRPWGIENLITRRTPTTTTTTTITTFVAIVGDRFPGPKGKEDKGVQPDTARVSTTSWVGCFAYSPASLESVWPSFDNSTVAFLQFSWPAPSSHNTLQHMGATERQSVYHRSRRPLLSLGHTAGARNAGPGFGWVWGGYGDVGGPPILCMPPFDIVGPAEDTFACS